MQVFDCKIQRAELICSVVIKF